MGGLACWTSGGSDVSGNGFLVVFGVLGVGDSVLGVILGEEVVLGSAFLVGCGFSVA